ncbi:type II restriction enzyme [Methanobacterium spitsbergense]|uniref:Uncharacterized protein n=1 Tax=Methanobacterium spitsbergense TaxID=2874285 RepID=A0A8T5UYI8_9EURY|nr:hypothetical protein [Methanobacterium spitsbergense]MBZ2164485.1 hypothetical protein [Methanobacterium spitsbergense]
MTKNDDAWVKLFEDHDILNEIEEKGMYEIESSEINLIRESRLMAKFDYKNQLPQIFKDNNLSILPISRGKYVISSFDVYHNLEEKTKEIDNCVFPSYIESIDFNNIKSETQAINCAYITGIISDFLEDKEIYPTVEGRMTSGQFDFKILDTKSSQIFDLEIDNSQIEIDGAYEGLDFLSLFEAKIEYPENFLVRQLYFPFRTLNDRVSKNIKNIFLVYSNGIYSLYEYVFENKDCYNSLKLIKQKNYSIIDGDIEIEDIEKIVDSIETIQEPKIPFPQADVFERVINLCEMLKENRLSAEQITQEYSFDRRQSGYYTSAGVYLDLIEKISDNGTIVYQLTQRGNRIFNLNLKERQLDLVKCILEHEVFLNIIKLWFRKASPPSKNEIVENMKKIDIYNIESESTYKRRSSTVKRWVEWILQLRNI